MHVLVFGYVVDYFVCTVLVCSLSDWLRRLSVLHQSRDGWEGLLTHSVLGVTLNILVLLSLLIYCSTGEMGTGM